MRSPSGSTSRQHDVTGQGEQLAILISAGLADRILDEGSRQLAQALGAMQVPACDASGGPDLSALGPRTEFIVTGWDTPQLTEEILDRAPNLRLIAHTGGTVRAMLPASIYDRGIALTTVARVLGESVAEFTLMAMLVGLRRFNHFADEMAAGTSWGVLAGEPATRSLQGRVVGIIGASRVGRAVIELLRPFGCRVLVTDPFVGESEASALGVTSVDLGSLLAESDIVSMHAPVLPETVGLLGRAELARIRDGALVINTARAALIDTEALASELRRGRLTAILDVFDEEPLPVDSEWRTMRGVVATPHIAALTADTLLAQGREALSEVERLTRGDSLRYPVSRDAYDRIA